MNDVITAQLFFSLSFSPFSRGSYGLSFFLSFFLFYPTSGVAASASVSAVQSVQCRVTGSQPASASLPITTPPFFPLKALRGKEKQGEVGGRCCRRTGGEGNCFPRSHIY